MDTPLLFIIFNRPDWTSQTWEVIKKQRPSCLYVASDGPRRERPKEKELVEETRQLIQVDWPCNLQLRYLDENLGCKLAIEGALDWFFSENEFGIILEDDCVADSSFFNYATELLHRYQNDERIAVISGSNYHFEKFPHEYDYYFSRIVHIWGWATWKRVWLSVDKNLTQLNALQAGKLMENLGCSKATSEYWYYWMQKSRSREIDAWSYALVLSVAQNHQLCINPARNLVSNIGFGNSATNSGRSSPYGFMPTHSMPENLKHPIAMAPFREGDEHTEYHMFRTRPLLERVLRKCFKMITGRDFSR